MPDKKFEIGIESTANTKGFVDTKKAAEDATKATVKMTDAAQANVRIIDYATTMRENRERRAREGPDTSLQDQNRVRRAGNTYGLATPTPAEAEARARATREAAAAEAELEAAMRKTAQARADLIMKTGEEALVQAKANQAKREASAELAKVTAAMRANVAIDLGRKIVGEMRQMAAMGKEAGNLGVAIRSVATATDSFTSGITAFLATGSPTAAVAAQVVTGFADVSKAYRDMEREKLLTKNNDAKWKASLTSLADVHKAVAASVRADQMDALFAAEATEAERLGRALDNNEKVRQARSAADAAEADLGAGVQGADPYAARSNKVTAEITDELDSMNADLERAKIDVQKAQITANETSEAAVVAANSKGIWSEAAKKAQEVSKRAGEDLTAAEEAVRTIEEVNAEKRRGLEATTKKSMEDVTRDASAAVTDQAQAVVAAIDQKAAEQGGELTKTAYNAQQQIVDILRDKIPDGKQAELIAGAIRNYQASAEGREAEQFSAMLGVIANVTAMGAKYAGLKKQVDAQAAYISGLSSSPSPLPLR